MQLEQLVADVPGARIVGDATVAVTAVTHDSRAVTPGCLFCCIPGARADGHDFAPTAVAGGAGALLCERDLNLGVPCALVPEVRRAMGPVAATFHQHPSLSLKVVGVTGTDGKSTTVHLVAQILEANGWVTPALGNLLSADADPTGARPSNTPEAPVLQATLARARDEGAHAIAMEVSSPALAQHRVDGTRFAVAVFTNLSRDHLDVHGTMEAYFAAKARLFESDLSDVAVVNADDEHGRRLLDGIRIRAVPFGLRDARDLVVGPGGSRFRWRDHTVALGLAAEFNVMNALAAATACAELGVATDVIAEALSRVTPAPGRLEPVEAGQSFSVYVDYAHTPNGLEEVLRAARRSAGRPPIVVFGCGGDKDRTKRPLMGEVAGRMAKLAVITSDNPRTEDPMAIIDEVRRGVAAPAEVVVEPDRRTAIEIALRAAGPGDVVVIAGKGHETGQTVQGVTTPFDDRVVAREVLDALRGEVRT